MKKKYKLCENFSLYPAINVSEINVIETSIKNNLDSYQDIYAALKSELIWMHRMFSNIRQPCDAPMGY